MTATPPHLNGEEADSICTDLALGRGRCRGRLRGQCGLLLAHELLERLGLGAADLLDRVGHGKACGIRRETGRTDRFPERGKMLDRMRVPAAGEGLLAPLGVGD